VQDRAVEGAERTSAHPATGYEAGKALDDVEREQVERRAAPAARVVHETIRLEGEDELSRRPSALWWSGVAAGLSMGVSVIAQALLGASLPDAEWRPLIAAFGYTVGFVIVVLARQQLFTENTLTPILPLLTARNRETLVRVARLWAIVLAANIVGAAIIAWVITSPYAFGRDVRDEIASIGQAAFAGEFVERFVRGIFAGWLIALMVWVLPAAEQSRVAVIVIITYVVGLAGLTHIVAGSIEVLSLVATGSLPMSSYLVDYFVPVLAGNVVGGVALVAALNHAQVASESEPAA
jgi:formate/nitrite transporter FocA (FNT family)